MRGKGIQSTCFILRTSDSISNSILEGQRGLKKKEPEEFGVLEVKLYATKEKYSFILSRNSEEL